MIAKETIQAVHDVSIVDVFRDYGIELKRAGATLKCCCPLHQERTPSCSVSEVKNVFHCFSCHESGSAVSFVMKYRNIEYADAIQEIARNHNITVKYESEVDSEELKKERLQKESMMKTLTVVNEFYVSQLEADNEEAKEALKYVKERWGDGYTDFLIGYAPSSNKAFYDFIKSRNLSKEILKELGLIGENKETHKEYVQFRERITIPIHDRLSRIIGFTCRYIGNNEDILKSSKYKNSSESVVFKKDENLFNLHTAAKAAAKSDAFIMVEGAPDAIRLQMVGLLEAVAPLGTALNVKQIKLLKKFADTVTFIPDSDSPKEGEAFGPGVKAVMKNGILAMKNGMNAYVKEIPLSEEEISQGVKKDADTYITSREIYDEIPEVDFIVWYAKKRFAVIKKGIDKIKELSEIAEILGFIEDKKIQEFLVEQLCKVYGKKKDWINAIQGSIQKRREKEIKELEMGDLSDKEKIWLRKSGIILKDGCYAGEGYKNEYSIWCNFTLKPIIHVKNNSSSRRVVKLKTEDGYESIIEFEPTDLVKVDNFRTKLLKTGMFDWDGDSEALKKLVRYINHVSDEAELIDCMGWDNDKEIYAFSNGIISNGKFHEADELGVVKNDKRSFFLPACSYLNRNDVQKYDLERKFKYLEKSDNTIYDFVNHLIEVYGEGGKVAFSWVLSTIFRDIIYKYYGFFPVLNIFGKKGSGKTDLAIALASLFYKLNSAPISCTNASIPSIAYTLSHIRNAAFILDEFTNDMKVERIELIKGLWGGTTQAKMSEEKKPVYIPVYCGVILAGQYSPIDEAIFSRVIQIKYNKTTFSIEEKKKYKEFMKMVSEGQNHLVKEILKHRDYFERTYEIMFESTMDELNSVLKDTPLEDRLQKNWCIILTTMRILENHISLPYSYKDLFEICVRLMKEQNETATAASDTAGFWSMLDTLHSAGKVKERCHFVIKKLASFKPIDSKLNERVFVEPRRVIFINFKALKSIFENYSLRTRGTNKIDATTLKSYLVSLSQFLGRKEQRFQFIKSNGEQNEEYRMIDGQQTKIISGNKQKALCFDYDAIKEKFDINLETYSFTDAEINEDEIEINQIFDEDENDK